MVRQDDLIYDVGANNGDDTEYYLRKGFRVLAIEADPILIAVLQARFADAIAGGHVTLLNVVLAPERMIAPFWICEDHNLWSSSDREMATRSGRRASAVELECWPLRDVLAEFGTPHYLKLSLHGQDHFCLADLSPETAPTLLSLELPRDLSETQEIFRRLVALGYRGFKVIDQTNHLQIVAPVPTLRTRLRRRLKRHPRLYSMYTSVKFGLQRLIRPGGGAATGAAGSIRPWDRAFPDGSSGPFGENTDGPWLPADEAMRNWKTIIGEHQSADGEALSVWHDLHASRQDPVAQPEQASART